MKYPLAPNGVFHTIQGEGHLMGEPMVFVRLAGCSVGCAECDTDYTVAERVSAGEIAIRIENLRRPTTHWVWITGGEPTDHDLTDLVLAIKDLPFIAIALATAGVNPVARRSERHGVNFISISPHDPAKWVHRSGCEVKLCPGLNGVRLSDFEPLMGDLMGFPYKFVSPCDGKPDTVKECVDWVEKYQGWKMTTQAHKRWNLA